MRRSSLLLVALACVAPATAQAQDIMVTVREFTGRTSGNFDLMDLATVGAVPITQAECDAGAQITFRFTNIDSSRSNLHLYSGANCDDVMIRNSEIDNRCSELAGPFPTEMRSQLDLTIGVDELVPCGEGGGGVITIWVLAVNNTMSDEVSGAGQKASFPVAYDFQGPGAPGDFQARGGQTSMTLSWESSTSQVTEYEIFVDPAGCMDGMVTSSLADDPEAPDPALLARSIDGPSSGAQVQFPESVPIPGEAAVAVRAADRSGNPGTLSAVRCVERFEVMTWFDMYCGAEGAADACSGGCSASTPSRSAAPLALLALVFGAVLVRRRRR